MNTNSLFQKGTFEGYKVRGRCKVVKEYEHQLENYANRLKKPGSGSFMALLDDPSLISETDGTRLPDGDLPPGYAEKNPVDFFEKRASGIASPVYEISSEWNTTTASRDGAYLELVCNLKEKSQLRIRWDFLIGEASDNSFALNDFALIDIIDNKTNGLVSRQILQQTADIPLGHWSTGWRSFTWNSPMEFKAKIRIVVCNGYSFSVDNPPSWQQLEAARSFPSGLLIDCITIV